MRTDARDRFGTNLEKDTQKQVENMLKSRLVQN